MRIAIEERRELEARIKADYAGFRARNRRMHGGFGNLLPPNPVSALAVSAAAFFISSAMLMQRFEDTELDSEGRLLIYRTTSQAIRDNPLLGFGYGAYEDGFKLYRGEQILSL